MGDRLDEYRAKRQAGATPEPFGTTRASRPRLFVVQKHWASALHYDFRLEYKGVLLSWAVPRGPSSDPEIKRLAIRTEDHPVEYADFEGVIPEGNYGAGQVIVWDQGSWVEREPVDAGLKKGKLLFELRGHKLKGVWTVFQTKKKNNNKEWLLLKKPDAYANEADYPEESVLSGRRVEELREGSDRAASVRAEAKAAGAKRSEPGVADLGVMLAQTREHAFSSPDWIYELKYDGFRLLCAKDRLLYRSGRDATALFPEIMRSMRLLPFDSVVLDTEACVLDEQGRPDFQRLQKRGQLSRRQEIERATVERPVVCFAFDLLVVDGHDLRDVALLERKRLLRMVLPPAGVLRYADHIEERGEEFFEQVRNMKLEGVMAKRADAPYRAGRSSQWLKLKAERVDDFVIVGWTDPKRGRAGLGALHLAGYEGGELAYLGRVGTGLTDLELEQLRGLLEPLGIDAPPCAGPAPKTSGNHWARPVLVCEVRYKERTGDGLLRQPAFVALRDDKSPGQCEAPEMRAPPPEPAARLANPAKEPRRFAETNLHKVFWPKEQYTKGDLIGYYRAVAPFMLPYLEDRPVVMTRYPDGIDGKSFYQKDAPEWAPDWLRTERVWSEQTKREIDYFVCDTPESLAYLANLGTIPLHVWSSRVTDLAKPDWCILDLDPKGAPFLDVVKIARAIHRLCEAVEFPNYVKTSGSTGLHVLLPLHRQCTYDQSRQLGELIARIVEKELGAIATTARTLRRREGKVYIDFGQNAHGQLLVAPYSVRPLPGAPVSAPLRWTEVNAKLSIGRFTIKTMPARLKRMKTDPLRPVLDERPDLVQILGRLAELLSK